MVTLWYTGCSEIRHVSEGSGEGFKLMADTENDTKLI